MARRNRKRRLIDVFLVIAMLCSLAALFGVRLLKPIPDSRWMCRDPELLEIIPECEPYREAHRKR
jgi:hypothetical protein